MHSHANKGDMYNKLQWDTNRNSLKFGLIFYNIICIIPKENIAILLELYDKVESITAAYYFTLIARIFQVSARVVECCI